MSTTTHISYTLGDSQGGHGHSLGINDLVIDKRPGILSHTDNATLYSAGRDGVISAWSISSHSASAPHPGSNSSSNYTQFFKQISTHTHWINSICLAADSTLVASASSDLTVRAWNPISNTSVKVGQHNDYVKCVAPIPTNTSAIVTGSLDQKISFWDVTNAVQQPTFSIDLSQHSSLERGSVYALATGDNVIASGGPDALVSLWDYRSGDFIFQFKGHTDNIRSLLVNPSGTLILSGSSDSTIKLWSLKAGRLLSTYNLHDTSVWNLYSEDPQFRQFYSADRSGLLFRTTIDTDLHNFSSILVAHEHQGINSIVAAESSIWTATSNSRMHRWKDVNHDIDPSLVEKSSRRSTLTTIPSLQTHVYDDEIEPYRKTPEETMEGRSGLMKHLMLKDRRRVLTLDTAGEVLLWDLIQCKVIRKFNIGTSLEDAATEYNSVEPAVTWCDISTRTGKLAVFLDPNKCFEAEVYADELFEDSTASSNNVANGIDHHRKSSFPEDHRINLGRWVLTYLFQDVLKIELERDAAYRASMIKSSRSNSRSSDSKMFKVWTFSRSTSPKASPVVSRSSTPAPSSPTSGQLPRIFDHTTKYAPEDPLSGEKEQDEPDSHYDSTSSSHTDDEHPSDASKSGNTQGSFFGKIKSLSRGKVSRTGSSSSILPKKDETDKDPNLERVPEAKDAANGEENGNGTDSFMVDSKSAIESLVAEIRSAYTPENCGTSLLTPPSYIDAPPITIPPETGLYITEASPGSFGNMELYRGTLASMNSEIDTVEKIIPRWLAAMLLKNEITQKALSKVSFALVPWKPDDGKTEHLPEISGESTSRLSAYVMLRSRRILHYIDEKLEDHLKPKARQAAIEKDKPHRKDKESNSFGSTIDSLADSTYAEGSRPEDWLEIICNNEVVPPKMTLGTIRTQLWRSGGEIVLHYRRKIEAHPKK
ncbi:hypothetical protein CANCADRAFT_3834 [Tortispora caseinolytica NRRL Y-17796]|uniref:Uncharacterized protein n=1 Tax=Tortispora caseinolytica NRRL Y-17796 TaxID=767744 RepID=A0A1E4TBR7_9ASCO|nr:hypothetical protein CANCADRAFT_3834 [Tortispora caseinolytica NRRL Y-17796]